MFEDAQRPGAFAVGIALGAVGFGVALVAAEAIRRRRAGRTLARIVIDGVRPIDPLLLDAMPVADEPKSPLASEPDDVDPISQRW